MIKSLSPTSRGMLAIAGIAALVFFFGRVSETPTQTPEAGQNIINATPTIVPPGPTPVIPPNVSISRADRSYNFLIADLTISNPNSFTVADTEIVCDITASSGTRIGGYRETIYQVVPANGKIKVQQHRFGYWPDQGNSLSCFGNSASRR